MNFLAPAVSVLVDYYRRPQDNLRLVLARFLRGYGGGDKGALTRTVYGVVRKEIALDRVVSLFQSKPGQQPPLPTRVLLRIAVFLLLYSDSYPEYAVVNEAVGAAARREKPFVNAVLRQLLRRKNEVVERIRRGDDPVLAYSISPLLLAGLRRLGAAGDADLEYLDREPVFHLRYHPGRLTAEEARKLLERAAIPCRELPALGCFETAAAGRFLEETERLGAFYIQNSGSQAVAFAAAARSRREVCDVAAAPGGKSLTLACLRPELRICASDVSAARLRLLEQNLRRLRLDNVRVFAADALDYPAAEARADLVILDAPCTSSGTLRKNPDLKGKITPEALRDSASLQRRLLDAVAVRFPRSLLLYAVCSFLSEEGEEAVARAAVPRGFRPVPLAPLLERYGFRVKREEFGVYLLPSDLNNDLFYISLLEPK